MKTISLLILISSLVFSGEYEKVFNDFINAKANTFEVYNIDGHSFNIDRLNINVNTGVFMNYAPVNGRKIISKISGDISVSLKVDDPIEQANIEKRYGSKSFNKNVEEIIIIAKESFSRNTTSSYMMMDMYNEMSFEDHFKDMIKYYTDDDPMYIDSDILSLATENVERDIYFVGMRSGTEKFLFEFNGYSSEEASLTEIKLVTGGDGYRGEPVTSFQSKENSEKKLWEKEYKVFEEDNISIDVKLDVDATEGRGFYKSKITRLDKDREWYSFVMHDGLVIDSMFAGDKKITELYNPEESSRFFIKLPKGTQDEFELQAWFSGEFVDHEKYYNLKSQAWYPKFSDGNEEIYNYTVTYPAKFEIIGNGEPEIEKLKTNDANFKKASFTTPLPVGSPRWEIGSFKHKKYELVNGRDLNIYYYSSQDFKQFANILNNAHKFFATLIGDIPARDYNIIFKPTNNVEQDNQIQKELKWYSAGILVGRYPYTYISGDLIAYPEMMFDFRFLASVIGSAVQSEYMSYYFNDVTYKDRWISTGISSELGYMFTEAIYGEESERLLKDFNNFRIDEFEAGQKDNPGPIILDYKLNYNRENYAVRNSMKAIGVMHMLRSYLKDYNTPDPDKKFKKLVKLLFANIKDKKLHNDLFLAVLNTVAEEDMSWYIYEWVMEDHYPKIEYATKIEEVDGNTSMAMRIKKTDCPDDFFVHVPVKLVFDNGNTFEVNILVPVYPEGSDVPLTTIEVPFGEMDVEIEEVIVNYGEYSLIKYDELEWEEIQVNN